MSLNRSDLIASLAVVVSLLAATFSYFASENARLDARRQATRSDAIALLDAVQNRLVLFKCHSWALEQPVDESDPMFKNIVEGLETARSNLSLIDHWKDHQIDAYRTEINTSPASYTSEADQLISGMRAKLSEESLARVDRVCRPGT